MVLTDSSAAKGTSNRRGLGKHRHLDTRYLWVQQRTRNGDIAVEKVPGDENSSDILTKHLDSVKMNKCMKQMGFHYCEGRSSIAKELIKGDIVVTFDQ